MSADTTRCAWKREGERKRRREESVQPLFPSLADDDRKESVSLQMHVYVKMHVCLMHEEEG